MFCVIFGCANKADDMSLSEKYITKTINVDDEFEVDIITKISYASIDSPAENEIEGYWTFVVEQLCGKMFEENHALVILLTSHSSEGLKLSIKGKVRCL